LSGPPRRPARPVRDRQPRRPDRLGRTLALHRGGPRSDASPLRPLALQLRCGGAGRGAAGAGPVPTARLLRRRGPISGRPRLPAGRSPPARRRRLGRPPTPPPRPAQGPRHDRLAARSSVHTEEPRMNLVILTGAGVSAESGVPTFRASDGLWEGHRVEAVATPEGFAADPALVQDFYNQRRRQLASVHPNAAPRALAELAARGA